jgi:hypothetical protein
MLIDYALPTMKAEKALKDLHEAMTERRYKDALKLAIDAGNNIQDIQYAVVHETEQSKIRESKHLTTDNTNL